MPPAQTHPIALHAVDGGRSRRSRRTVLLAPPAQVTSAAQAQLDVLQSVLARAAPVLRVAHSVAQDDACPRAIDAHAGQTVSLRCDVGALTLLPDATTVRVDHVRTYRPCIRSTADALDLLLFSAPPVHVTERAAAVCTASASAHDLSGVAAPTLKYALRHARRLGRRQVCVLLADDVAANASSPAHTALAAEYPDIEIHYRAADQVVRALAAGSDTTDMIVADSHIARLVRSVAQGLCGVESLATSSVLSPDHGAVFFPTDTAATPSLEALLLVTAQMLLHAGQLSEAVALSDAVLKALEDGVHTGGIALLNPYAHRLDDASFGRAVIDRLELRPVRVCPVFNLDDLATRPSRPPRLRLVP